MAKNFHMDLRNEMADRTESEEASSRRLGERVTTLNSLQIFWLDYHQRGLITSTLLRQLMRESKGGLSADLLNYVIRSRNGDDERILQTLRESWSARGVK